MNPICSFVSSGTPVGTIIGNMTAQVSAQLKDRPFRYLDTIVVPEQTALGQITYSVTMLFEVETQQALEEFQEVARGSQNGSGILKPI